MPTIARRPVDPNDRGRMGHEHWLQDSAQIRERGVDVLLEWADPNLYPRAAATAPHDGRELVSVELPDGRFIDFTLLNPALRARLSRSAPDLLLRRRHRRPAALSRAGRALRRLALVDQSRLGRRRRPRPRTPSANRSPPGRRTSTAWHTKLLRYLAPLDTVRLEDNGRRLYGVGAVGDRRRGRRRAISC